MTYFTFCFDKSNSIEMVVCGICGLSKTFNDDGSLEGSMYTDDSYSNNCFYLCDKCEGIILCMTAYYDSGTYFKLTRDLNDLSDCIKKLPLDAFQNELEKHNTVKIATEKAKKYGGTLIVRKGDGVYNVYDDSMTNIVKTGNIFDVIDVSMENIFYGYDVDIEHVYKVGVLCIDYVVPSDEVYKFFKAKYLEWQSLPPMPECDNESESDNESDNESHIEGCDYNPEEFTRNVEYIKTHFGDATQEQRKYFGLGCPFKKPY